MDPSNKDITKSINSLKQYKERLKKIIVKSSAKLKLPQQKIEQIFNDHNEINELDKTLNQLIYIQEKNIREQ